MLDDLLVGAFAPACPLAIAGETGLRAEVEERAAEDANARGAKSAQFAPACAARAIGALLKRWWEAKRWWWRRAPLRQLLPCVKNLVAAGGHLA